MSPSKATSLIAYFLESVSLNSGSTWRSFPRCGCLGMFTAGLLLFLSPYLESIIGLPRILFPDVSGGQTPQRLQMQSSFMSRIAYLRVKRPVGQSPGGHSAFRSRGFMGQEEFSKALLFYSRVRASSVPLAGDSQ